MKNRTNIKNKKSKVWKLKLSLKNEITLILIFARLAEKWLKKTLWHR
jgi:hypothetical protein